MFWTSTVRRPSWTGRFWPRCSSLFWREAASSKAWTSETMTLAARQSTSSTPCSPWKGKVALPPTTACLSKVERWR
ncbi:unnamed protein product, partial [Symbiodinium microadriaticum]